MAVARDGAQAAATTSGDLGKGSAQAESDPDSTSGGNFARDSGPEPATMAVGASWDFGLDLAGPAQSARTRFS